MTKRSIFTLLVVLATLFSVNAQIGVRAGLNLSSITSKQGGESFTSDGKIGFQIGVTNDFKLSDNLVFRPGLLYSAKGGSVEIPILGSISTTYSYLDIPLSFIYNFSTEDTGFFAELGPYVGFLLAASAEGTDVKEGLESLDFGVNVGIGYDLGKIIVGANYGLGLANIAKTEEEDASANNRNISVYGIYQF